MQRAFLLVGLAALASAAAYAQTDVAASLYGAFGGTTTHNEGASRTTTQSPANATGGMLEVRHIAHPWFGYEGTYSFNRANQTYSEVIPLPCPSGGCGQVEPAIEAISANAHEITGDWVASLKVRNLRPFALAGGGILFDVPTTGQAAQFNIIQVCGNTPCAPTTTAHKPVFVYGGGVDWKLVPHIGLRFQYRGNLYKAPNLTTLFTSTGAFMHTAEPMIGVYFRL
jgi:opacity protein-like surface antigen